MSNKNCRGTNREFVEAAREDIVNVVSFWTELVELSHKTRPFSRGVRFLAFPNTITSLTLTTLSILYQISQHITQSNYLHTICDVSSLFSCP